MTLTYKDLSPEQREKAEEMGLNRHTISYRLRNGQSIEKAISCPAYKSPTLTDRNFTSEEIEVLNNNEIDEFLLRKRLKTGWSINEAIYIPRGHWKTTCGFAIFENMETKDIIKAGKQGLTQKDLIERVLYGLTLEQALSFKDGEEWPCPMLGNRKLTSKQFKQMRDNHITFNIVERRVLKEGWKVKEAVKIVTDEKTRLTMSIEECCALVSRMKHANENESKDMPYIIPDNILARLNENNINVDDIKAEDVKTKKKRVKK